MPRATKKKTEVEEVVIAAEPKAIAEPVQETVKKKPAAKRTSKKAAKTDLFIEFNGVQVSADEIVSNVKATYTAKGEEADIKELKLYIKPDENAVYYVVNDEFSDKMDCFFC